MDLYEYTQTLVEEFVKDRDSTVANFTSNCDIGYIHLILHTFLSHLRMANKGMDGKLCTRV